MSRQQILGSLYNANGDGRFSAEKIKEDYTYVCQDIVKEFKKFDTDPYKYFARFSGEHSVTGRVRLHGTNRSVVTVTDALAEIRP